MKKALSCIILCLLIPAVVLGGWFLFRGKQYLWISICVALLSCLPFFLRFEKSAKDAKRLILVATLTALAVLGRIAFATLPSFKPVTAFVILSAMYFGSDAGFLTGALSALLSNIYFGQGSWTPFQMFAWGMVGFLAGLLAKPLRKSRIVRILYAIVSGVLFSMIMDIQTVLWIDNSFNLTRYAAAIASSASVTVIYAVSNVIFLLLFAETIGRILERIKRKYGL